MALDKEPNPIKESFSKLKTDEKKSADFIFQNIPLWIASCLVGLVAVFFTKLLSFGESIFISLYNMHKAWVFVLSPIFFFLSYYTVKRFSKYANGSGIPQIMASLSMPNAQSKILTNQLLSIRVILVKIVSSFFMSLGGGVIGREGPTIQVAASILFVINRIVPDSWPKISHKLMIITGGASGLAAAFNTPLGGIVFAIEELSRNNIRYLRTAVFSSVIIAGFTAQTILGPYLIFGYPDVNSKGFSFFFILLLVTIICGIAGAYFGKIIFFINSFKKTLTVKKQYIFGFVAVMIFATIVFFTNQDTVGSGDLLLDRLLFKENKMIEWYIIPARIFNGIVSFTNGGAGGIFAPALSFGGSIGAYMGQVFTLAPKQVNMLVLVGMVAFLTAFTRSPFTCAVLVLEMTDRHNTIFYLLIAAWGANLIASRIADEAYYEKTAEGIAHDMLQELEEATKKSEDENKVKDQLIDSKLDK